VLSFYGLSFGEDLAKEISSTKFSNDFIQGQWILYRKGGTPFSSLVKAGFGSDSYVVKSSKDVKNRESSMNPEITNTLHSPTKPEIPEKLHHFETSQPSKGKSSYHFGKIQLTRNNLDPSVDFISSLSLAKHKEENPLLWTLDKFKESDIFKSLGILLELKLNF
jgi:hypothetical protein